MAVAGTESASENPASQIADDTHHMTSDSQEDDEEEGETTDEDCLKTGPVSDVTSRVNEPIRTQSSPTACHDLAERKSEKITEHACTVLRKVKDEIINTDGDPQLTGSSHSKLMPSGTSKTDDVIPDLKNHKHTSRASMTSDMSPLVLLSKSKNVTLRNSSSATMMASHEHPSSSSQTEDQPLDLSTKTDKDPTASTASTKPHGPPATASQSRVKSSSPPPFPAANGLSSLQSLQQRFGGNSPIELVRRPGAGSIIALQPTLTPKGMASSLHPSAEELLRLQGVASKAKLGVLGEWMDKGDGRVSRSPSSSPSRKAETSGPLPALMSQHEENGLETRSKHTIHRCSCQKAFNSLYAMSLHIQETGHTPLSGKSMSLMDYPKLVRGQDMWLNQESEQTRRILRCMQCGESFKSLPLLTVHMMQTQHYTKIVSAEHGRRSHKCSTYCDRDLDRECIFKCKVCQDAFTDMEGLANHMIVSGHHKKQASRVIPPPSSVIDATSSLTSSLRHGKRKRFLPEDDAGSNGFTVANLLEYKKKQQGSLTGLNGFGKSPPVSTSSPSSPPASNKFLACDSCGKRVEPHSFDGHVRACLRQRAEVIDALKSKLAAEEAILSRSESKLLKSGFALSSLSGSAHEESMVSKLSHEKTNDEGLQRKRTHSDTTLGNFATGHRHSPKLKPEAKAWMAVDKKPSTFLDRNYLEATSGGAEESDSEVPLQWWRHSTENTAMPSDRIDSGRRSGDPAGKNRSRQIGSPQDLSKHEIVARVKEEAKSPFPDRLETGSHASASDSEERRSCVSGRFSRDKSPDSVVKQSISNSGLISDSDKESVDYGSSALHKLDMFSRGLPLPGSHSRECKRSPPPPHPRHHKKSEVNDSNGDGKTPKGAKPSSTPSASASSCVSPSSASFIGHRVKSESPDPQPRSAVFDLLDPNVDDLDPSEGGALEAMESFIKKSFSPKSDLRTSNLISMFSPFGNSFPLPGSVPGTLGGIPLNPADPSVASFAKFSKFFSMVPGAAVMHPSASQGPSLMAKAATQPPEVFGKALGKRPLSKIEASAAVSPPLKAAHGHGHSAVSAGHAPWKSTGQSERQEESVLDLKGKAMKVSDKPSGQLKRAAGLYNNDACESPSLQNGESRLPSSVELNERQDFLRKKRRLTCDSNPSPAKSPKMDTADEELGDRCESGKACIRSDGNALKTESVEVEDKDNVRIRVTSLAGGGQTRSGHSPSRQTQRDATMLPAMLSSPVAHSPMPEMENQEKTTVSVASPTGLELSPRCVPRDTPPDSWHQEVDLKPRSRSPSRRGDKEGKYSVDDVDHSEGRLASCSSPESVHSDSMVARGRHSRLPRQRSSSMEETSLASFPYANLQSQSSGFLDAKVRRGEQPEVCLSLTEDKEDKLLDVGHLEDKVPTNPNESLKRRKHSLSDKCDETQCKKFSVSRLRGVETKKEDGVEEMGETCDNQSEPDEREASRSVSTTPDATRNNFLEDAIGQSTGDEEEGGGRRREGRTKSEVNRRPPCDGQEEEDLEEGDSSGREEKTSALDSLSSFVYSQPLTSEHPLDSLQRLFTAREAIRLSSNGQHVPVTSSNQPTSQSHDSTSPLNLTIKGGSDVGGADCASSEDNEEVDNEADFSEGGVAADGEITEYKCAACNRRFASKGSYRYHLSRCHLSSVKKYGIKEAFNMSPYVYLPLDHTAKFSKYYQMAQELANKGK